MHIDIVLQVKQIKRMTAAERLTCSKLHFKKKNGGTMWEHFCTAERVLSDPNDVDFGSYKFARVILAKENDKIVAWLLYDSSWNYPDYVYLSVYVSKAYRRLGIGTMLLKRAKQLAKRQGLKVITFVPPKALTEDSVNWHRVAKQFYERGGIEV